MNILVIGTSSFPVYIASGWNKVHLKSPAAKFASAREKVASLMTSPIRVLVCEEFHSTQCQQFIQTLT